MTKINHVIVVGSGPVGSFMAVLCTQLGLLVTVYEKREEFNRSINLKIENNFFKEVQEVLSRLKIKSEFFTRLNECLYDRKDRIVIMELEEKFIREAKLLGAQYIVREVKSFEELYKEHEDSTPIILDCTGRNSKLRTSEFGSDKNNIVTTPLRHAMYINFKAKITNDIPYLYQTMKYIKDIKLTEIVVSNHKNENGFSDITIPIFITDKLACIFDKEYPDINKNPLNLFNSLSVVPDSIFFPVSSLLGQLIVDGWSIDLNNVKVKKIEISCGYASKRSKGNYICLGDSAVSLAFFRSLNLGLKHALEFFIRLSMFHKETNLQIPEMDNIIMQFKQNNPHLNPIKVYPTEARNVFLVITKLMRYGCFSYCLTNHKRERITSRLGVNMDQIDDILEELNQNLSTWSYLLTGFEIQRDKDIKSEIQSNKVKNISYDYVSWFIDINSRSVIKISELARAVKGKYALYHKDFEFLLRCFKARKEVIESHVNSTTSDYVFITIVSNLLNQWEIKDLDQLKRVCAEESLSIEEKIKLISDIINSEFTVKKCKRELVSSTDNISVSSSFILSIIRNELIQIQKSNEPIDKELQPNQMLDNTNCESAKGHSWQR